MPMGSFGFLSSYNSVVRGKRSQDPEAAMLDHWLDIIKTYYTKETKFEEQNACPKLSSFWKWG